MFASFLHFSSLIGEKVVEFQPRATKHSQKPLLMTRKCWIFIIVVISAALITMKWQRFHDTLLSYLALQMFGFIVMVLLEVLLVYTWTLQLLYREVASFLSPLCCGVILYSDQRDHVQQVCVREGKRVFPWMASPPLPPLRKFPRGRHPPPLWSSNISTEKNIRDLVSVQSVLVSLCRIMRNPEKKHLSASDGT